MKKLRITIVSMLVLAIAVGCSDKDVSSRGPATVTPTNAIIASPKASTKAVPSVIPTTTPTAKQDNNSDGDKNGSNITANRNFFTVEVTLDTQNHKLNVKQGLDYINKTGKELKDIYFNLIPDAYKKKSEGVKMNNVTINDQKVKMTQVKGTVYKIDLPYVLAPGQPITINMEYEEGIPNMMNRYGYQKEVYNLGNFIIQPAVYEKDGWSVQPYVDMGDGFYTDLADYSVKIEAPTGYTVAASGTNNGTGTYTASNIRDFAFCASPSYKVLKEECEGIQIAVYYMDGIPETAKRAMETAQKSLKLYNKTFGKYPYENLSVVFSFMADGVGGMEYPSLIMLSTANNIDNLEEMGIDTSDKSFMESVLGTCDGIVCHEIAHQWFYAVVGNNQVSSPWLDEGLCRFSEYLYQKEYKPANVDERNPLTVDYFKRAYKEISEKGTSEESFYKKVKLDKSIYYYDKRDPSEYGALYTKGGSLIYKMEEKMGEKAFSKALKEYVKKFSDSFVTTESFKEFWNSKTDFSDLFKLYFK